MGVAQTFGYGSAATAGISYSHQVGVVYGADDRFGCFFSTCLGGASDVSLENYVATGFYNSYDDVRGTATAIVEEVGFPPPSVLSYSTSQILNQNDPPMFIGTEDALSIGVSLAPVSFGVYVCTTVVDTFVPPDGGRA